MIGHWWQAQSERDRRTLRWGAAVVALLLVWALVWHPLAQRRALLEQESAILTAYLPPLASDAEVQAFIAAIVATLAERSPKQMGVVMGALKARYGSDFDAKQASVWIKDALR